MKRIFPKPVRLTCLFLLLISVSACLKDNVTNTFRIQVPVYESLTQARSRIKSEAASPIQVPGKICLYKNYIFLNEPAQGVHVIDNTDPAHPINMAFINIPGNTEIAIKDDILYADESFGDLVAMDIRDPRQAVAKKFVPQVFYTSYDPGLVPNPDSVMVIKEWTSKDTTIRVSSAMPPSSYPVMLCAGCYGGLSSAPAASGDGGKSPGATGINGSTSAFAILGHQLYALSMGARLNVVDLSAATGPALVNRVMLTEQTQTIFPFENKLFLGAFSGMSVFDVSDPATPVKAGSFSHARACDPVISDGPHAFVTVHSGTACEGFSNELDILDMADFNNPVLSSIYQLTSPRGLAKDGNLLFICDGTDGLKLFDATDIVHLSLLKTAGGFEANDVIAGNGLAIVLATDGIHQFDYTDEQNIKQLSKLDAHVSTP